MAKAARVIGKVDLVGNVAQITELTKENAKKATNAVLEGMQALLQQSGKIQLAKFGSFSLRKTKSRRGRNPQTGQPMLIPPGIRIAFKVSKTWKDAVLAKEQEQLKDKVRIHTHKEALKAKPAAKPAVKPAAKKKDRGQEAVKVLFSPQGGISKELSRLIKAAKVEIDLAAYAFSSKYLGNALTAAQKRGVKVRIILDKDNADQAYSIDEWFIQQGIDTRFILVKNGCMHHKFMIIDAKMIMTGSYNFTNESEFRNYEVALFTNSKPLIKTFATEFERLWLLATGSAPAAPVLGGKGDYGG